MAELKDKLVNLEETKFLYEKNKTKIDELKSDLNDINDDIIRTKNVMPDSVVGKCPRNESGKIGFGTNATYAYVKIKVESGKYYSFSLPNSGFTYVTDKDGNIVVDSINSIKTEDNGLVYLMPENAYYLYWTVQNNDSWLNGNPNDVVIIGRKDIVGWTADEYPRGETISVDIPKLIYPEVIDPNERKIYYCGSTREYTTLKSVIDEATKHMDSVVYVDPEVFDLVSEFGTDYLDNYDGSNGMIGLWLKNHVHVIFSSGSKVLFNYTGSNENVHTYFSPFNAGQYGFTLENAWVESVNCRYSVHDERGGQTDGYRNIYKRCTFIHDSSNCSWGTHQAIGGGLGVHGDIEIDGCYFENIGGEIVDPGGEPYFNVSYHNSYAENAQSRIVIKNSYFATSALILRYGTSEKVSEMVVCGCSLKSEPQAYNYNSTPANVKCTSWNNVIRG